MGELLTEVKYWSRLMGRDLEKSDLQPLQPAPINRNGVIEISVKTKDALGFSVGDRVGMKIQDGLCMLRADTQGGIAFKPGKPVKLPVSEEIAKALSSSGTAGSILIGGKEKAVILPVIVQEHPPDVLGPRFIDELREDCIVRHAIPGPPWDGWAQEGVRQR